MLLEHAGQFSHPQRSCEHAGQQASPHKLVYKDGELLHMQTKLVLDLSSWPGLKRGRAPAALAASASTSTTYAKSLCLALASKDFRMTVTASTGNGNPYSKCIVDVCVHTAKVQLSHVHADCLRVR